MSKSADPIGVTLSVPGNIDAVGVYEADGGIPTFETGEPYTLSDGVTVQYPVAIFNAGGTHYTDQAGNFLQALPITGVTPPDPNSDGITWDANTTWDNGAYWS